VRFDSVADYARHSFPLHCAVGGDHLRVDGNTVIAHYTEPTKAVRVLETAHHELGHLETALVRLDVRTLPAPERHERPPTLEELFDLRDDPPDWLGVAAVLAVVAAALVVVRLLTPVLGVLPAVACALGGAVLATSVGFAVARQIAHRRRWRRYEARLQPMALAAVRTYGDAAISAVVAVMERFEPESVRVVVGDGWRSPQRARRERLRRRTSSG
jgi:hypothetical protein